MSKLADKLKHKLAQNTETHSIAQHETGIDLGRQHRMIDVDKIAPNPYQPRTLFDQAELEQLAESISETGLIQPITVRQFGDKYQLIAGERRWRAHQQLGKLKIEAIVQEANDSEMAVAALAENIDRAALSDYEIGKALRQVESLFPTRTRLAESVGITRQDIYKFYAFDALPAFVLEALDTNPRLIGRAEAEKIKVLITETNGSPESLEALQEAIDLVIKQELDQSKIVEYVRRHLRGEPMRTTPQTIDLTNAEGKKIGSVRHDGRNVIFTVRTGLLSAGKEKTLKNYIEQLINS